MPVLQIAKAVAKRGLPRLYGRWAEWQKRRLPDQIPTILSSEVPYQNYGEDVFDRMQRESARVWPNYSEDEYSNWRRGVDRVSYIVQLPTFHARRGQKMLEAACSDGMTGHMFAGYGYQVTLHDLEDWRDERTKHIDFVAGDLCKPLPLAAESFDLVSSWNSFEHVENPQAALAELVRVCKTGGHVYLQFNPLWCSPLGLHALDFNMPYPQFLFSPELIEAKIEKCQTRETAVPQDHWSFRKKHMDLMNKLRVEYFRTLWKNSGCEVLLLRETKNYRHLNIIANFPLAFTGRGLALDDVVTDGIEVMLAKK